jgi:hypothetical protein
VVEKRIIQPHPPPRSLRRQMEPNEMHVSFHVHNCFLKVGMVALDQQARQVARKRAKRDGASAASWMRFFEQDSIGRDGESTFEVHNMLRS